MPSAKLLGTVAVLGAVLGGALYALGVHPHNTLAVVSRDKVVKPFGISAPASSTPARILFVGDIFLDRYIREQSDIHGSDYPFSCADSVLESADFVVGNLEGPITDNPSISEGSVVGSAENYEFTFPTTTGALLLRHNIHIVDIGNNHIYNFGSAGIESTHQWLDKAGVGYFGGVKGDEPVFRTQDQNIPLSFVSYNQFGGQSAENVAAVVASEHAAGRTVIVFSHWGTEYSTSTAAIAPLAQLFVQSGAAAVIGAHPHIVLPHETIEGVPIYYSLGNFLFDQYWNTSVTHGLALMLTIPEAGVIKVQTYPTSLERDGRVCISYPQQ